MKVAIALQRFVAGFAWWACAMAVLGGTEGAEALHLSCSQTTAGTLWTAQGPDGAEFVVEASADLRSWTAVYADRFGTIPCEFIDPVRTVWERRFYRAVLGPPALGLADPAVMDAAPFSVLSLDVSGLDPSLGGVYARFFDDRGYAVEVPVIQVAPGKVECPVIPWLPALSAHATGQARSLHVVQRTAGEERISRTIRGFSIEDLPHWDHPPGSAVVHFLEGAVEHAERMLGEVQDTPFDTVEMRGALVQYRAQTTDLLGILREVQQAPSKPVPLGSLGGQPLMLDRRDLETLDRMVLGLLMAQATADGSTSGLAAMRTGSCAGREAEAYGNALLRNPDSAGEARSSYYRAYGGCTVSAFGIAYRIVAGAGGVGLSLAALAGAPAEALALASGALLYVTAEGAAGLVAISGALGQESAAAAQMLKTGVEIIEDLLRGPAKSALGEMAGQVLDLATSAASLKSAFTAVSLDPAPMTGVRPDTTYVGSVGGCDGGGLNGTIQVVAPANVAWTVQCYDRLEDPALELSAESGSGPATISIRIAAAPQRPTPGFTCDNIGYFQFSHTLDFTFDNGAFASVLVQYEYQLVL